MPFGRRLDSVGDEFGNHELGFLVQLVEPPFPEDLPGMQAGIGDRGPVRHAAPLRQWHHRAGAHAGTTGPFVILDFPEPTDPSVVYVETLAGDIYLGERADVNRYTIAFLTGCRLPRFTPTTPCV